MENTPAGLSRIGRTGSEVLAVLGGGLFVCLPLGLSAIGWHVVLAGIYDLPGLPWASVSFLLLWAGLFAARIGRLLWRGAEYGMVLTIMRRSQTQSGLTLLATVLTCVSSMLLGALAPPRGGITDLAAVLLGGTVVGFVVGREVMRQVQAWRHDCPPLPAELLDPIIRDFHDELREWQQVDGPSLVGTRGDLFRVQMGVVANYLERSPELARHEAEIYQALDRSVGM